MKKLREILDWIPLFLFIAGGITFAIYLQNWILLGLIILDLIILGIFLFGGFIDLMAMGLESSLRNQFPLDYLMLLTTEVDFFNEKGFQIINYLDPGSEHPGILMRKENSPDVWIILNAPINQYQSNYTVDVWVMKDPEISIKYLVRTNPESKIEKLNELYGKV